MPFDKSNIKEKPKKSLGQNFLVDDNFSRKIIHTMNIGKNDLILEIGSGYGSLTKHLVNFSDHIISIELDKEISEYLKSTYPMIKVINEDFLITDLRKLSEKEGKKIRIIGNIPYNITSPIIFQIFDNRKYIQDAQIMMQLDVCQRLIGKPRTKDYGILSVFSQVYSEPRLLFKVPPTCFYPKPRVLSGIVYFDLSKDISSRITNDVLFRKIVRTTFGKRRKMLSNTLKEIKQDIKLTEININPNKRPEELTPEEFIELSNEISRKHDFS